MGDGLETFLVYCLFCRCGPWGPWSILMVLFFLFSSWVVSLEMLFIISCILVHCVGEVSNLALFLMGSSSSLSLWDLSIHYSLRACVRFGPVSYWIPSHLIVNLPGLSGIFGLILGMRPLGGFFLSIAVVSNCIWWLALSIELTSLVIALMYPCWVLFSSVSVFVRLEVLPWNSSGWLSIARIGTMAPLLIIIKFKQEVVWHHFQFHKKWWISLLQFRLMSSLSSALFWLLEGPMDLGLDAYRYTGGLVVWITDVPPKQSHQVCFFISLLLNLVDP